jgi:8-oxo-dGTP pyrophosphatase MutT (NUDIX family)
MEPGSLLTILVYAVAPAGETHEYLLLRRLPAHGGFWQGVTGAVEPGEALDEAAIRELLEETGLTPMRLIRTDYQYTFRVRKTRPGLPPGTRITEQVFLALLDAKVDPTLDPAEHDAWDWFTYEDALTWLRWPENIEALRRCEALLTSGAPPRSS